MLAWVKLFWTRGLCHLSATSFCEHKACYADAVFHLSMLMGLFLLLIPALHLFWMAEDVQGSAGQLPRDVESGFVLTVTFFISTFTAVLKGNG